MDRNEIRHHAPPDLDLEEAVRLSSLVGNDDHPPELGLGMLHTQICIGGALLRIEALLRTFVERDGQR